MSLISLEGLSTTGSKLPIAVGSKLTSGQIDGDGGDRVVMRPGLLQHGAAERVSRGICQGRCKHGACLAIFYSVDAAIKRAP